MATSAISRPVAARAGVMRTGAIHCWDTEGHRIDPAGTGQDGALKKGDEPPAPRFDDAGDGTIVDRATGLTWMQDAGAAHLRDRTWRDALIEARHHGDGRWRLPNIRELLSLLDYGQDEPPLIARPNPFVNVEPAIYWTSTTLAPAPKLAWMITLGIGPTVFVVKTSKAHAWLVRGDSHRVLQTGQRLCWDEDGVEIDGDGSGQDGDIEAGLPLPARRFIDNHNGTITDDVTGLVWLKNANPFGFQIWADALKCCDRLQTGDAGLTDGSRPGDWRLPNIREIESLVDYGAVGPCLPQGHPFQNVRPSSYWTSTTVASGATEAMFIILGVGPSIFENKEHRFFVWPVRDPKVHP